MTTRERRRVRYRAENRCQECGSYDLVTLRRCQYCQTKNLEASRRSWRRIRREIITAYGSICMCCGETTYEFLAIDHIDGNGAAERRKYGSAIYRSLRRRGFPKEGYRLLCHNCNMSRGYYGYCPHQGGSEV